MSASRSSLPPQHAYAAPSQPARARRVKAPVTVRSSYTKKGMPIGVYWFALAAMVFCMFQCLRTIAVESYSMAARLRNMPIIEQYYLQTVQENKVLHERIQSASTRQGVEAMARNTMGFTGENEILVRLHY